MVRRMQNADAALAADIWLEANLQAHAFVPAGYWEAHYDEVRAAIPQAETYVFESKDGVLGFIGLDGGYIAGLFVRSAFRSGGVGKQLLDEAKRRKPRLCLKVYRRNRRAVRFYLREGFAIREEGTDGETGEAELTMEWTPQAGVW